MQYPLHVSRVNTICPMRVSTIISLEGKLDTKSIHSLSLMVLEDQYANVQTAAREQIDVRTPPQVLVAITSNIADADLLVSKALSNAVVLQLSAARSAIDQITDALSWHSAISSLHIVSHGSPGEIQLGEDSLSLATLQNYQEQLTSWKQVSPQLAQIVLYGCRVAVGDAGAELIDKVHALTGAEIAASRMLVGSSDKGGSCEFAARTSNFKLQSAFELDAFEAYPHMLGEFKILSLESTNAAVIDHDDLTGDDNGGIAVSDNSVFVTGDDSTGIFSLDLGRTKTKRYDGIFSDIETETVYTLGTDSITPLVEGVAATLITHLLEIDDETGELTGNAITLDTAISIDTDSDENGVFSGYGRVVVYDNTSENYYDIDINSGAVTNQGNNASPNFYESENWADWGVAEYFGGELYVTYRPESGSFIERLRVSDGVSSTVATFSDLSDLASFSVSPSNNRWYFHYEGGGQFDPNYEIEETLGYADATFSINSSTGEFQIISLTGNNSAVIDHDTLTGDDRGGIALSSSHVLVTGDRSTATIPLSLPSGSLPDLNVIDGLFSDIATGTVYTLGLNSTTALEAYDGTVSVTHLLEIDSQSRSLTGNTIELSRAIELDTDETNDYSAIFAGHERVVVWDNATGKFFNIDLPSGVVTEANSTAVPDHFGSENWAIWGVAEYFNDQIHVAYRKDNTDSIERLNLTTGATEIIADFDDLNDLASFSVSPTTNRWYFHYEGNGQFDPDGDIDELLGYADATYFVEPTESEIVPSEDASQLNILSKGTAKTLQIDLTTANVANATDLLIFSVDSQGGKTQLGNFSLLKGGELGKDFDQMFSLPADLLSDGTQLAFELVQAGEVQTGTLTATETGNAVLSFGDTALSIMLSDLPSTNLLVGDAEAIDLTGYDNQDVSLSMMVYREASFDSILKLYLTDSAEGGISDMVTNTMLMPGDEGYQEAAMARQLDTVITGTNGQMQRFSVTATGGGFVSMYLVADGTDETTSDVYYSHMGMNSDQDHVKLLGNNTFGFEDMAGLGDRDFNDIVVQFDVA